MTFKDLLTLDAELTKKMRIAENPGKLRTLAAFFAHSGDSWFWAVALVTVWAFGNAFWKKWAAVLLGALIIHNMQPGPLLFTTNPEVAYGFISSYLIANIIMVVLMLGAVVQIAKVMYIPKSYLLAGVLVFCVIGTYALGNRFFDVWVMLVFGLIGFGLEYCKVPLGPFVIGFVLSPIAEEQLRSALMMSEGNMFDLFTRPVATVFVVVSVLSLLWPVYQERMIRRQREAAAAKNKA